MRRATTFRRHWLDACLTACAPLMTGDVVDLGGKQARHRGTFKRPQARSWRVVNIDPTVRPDVIADLCAGVPLADACADTIICSEVLEHLLSPDAALNEARRLLRANGTLILSMPFVRTVGQNTDDYQWWTPASYRLRFSDADLTIWPMGGWIGTLASLAEVQTRFWPRPFRRLGWELCRLLEWLDLRIVSRSTVTTGYFVVVRELGRRGTGPAGARRNAVQPVPITRAPN